MPDAPAQRLPAQPRWPMLLVALALAWAAYVRALGLFTDFWFDEVWSWSQAMRLRSPWQVFTTLHHDNNHYLNTLWIYLLGDRTDWPVYRIPAVLTGLGVPLLLARIGLRRGAVEGVVAGLLGATSYLFLLYSTEARGYGPALFFALLCVDLLELYQMKPRTITAIAFSASAVLGLLSHMSFLFPYAGIVTWGFLADLRARSAREAARNMVRLHSIPAAVFALLYWIDLRRLTYLGGTPLSPWDMALEALSYTTGWPAGAHRQDASLALGATALAVTFVALSFQRDERRWLYLIGIVLAPLAVILVTRPRFFFPRYFLLCVPVYILMMSDFLGLVWKQRAGRYAVPALITAMCTGNVLLSLQFLRDGRGHFLQALSDMATATPGPEVRLGSNWDSHLRVLSEYYVRQIDSDKRFDFIPQNQWTDTSPDWLLWEYYDQRKAEPAIKLDSGAHYQLIRDYPFSARLSGASWWLYRRVPSG